VKIKNLKLDKKIILILLIIIIITCIALYFLTAKEDKQYLITFNTDIGTKIESVKTEKGGKVVYPDEIPNKENFIFNGWILDGKLLLEGTIIDKDIEVKASWADKGYDYYNVVYSPGNGYNDINILVEKNQRITEPIIPIVKDKEFKGWYSENGKFDFDARINNNIVLHAKWDDNACLNDSFTTENDECKKQISLSPTKKYSCEDDWELVNDNCVKPELTGKSIDATPNYTCGDGYVLNGSKCSKEVVTELTKNYNCSNGWLEGNGCYEYQTKTLRYQSLMGWDEATRQRYINETMQICMNAGGYLQGTGKYDSFVSCTKKEKIFIEYANETYSCPGGYANRNGKCVGTKTVDATVKEYVCPDGYKNADSKCLELSSTIQKEKAKVTEICYSGFELDNGKCEKSIILKAN